MCFKILHLNLWLEFVFPRIWGDLLSDSTLSVIHLEQPLPEGQTTWKGPVLVQFLKNCSPSGPLIMCDFQLFVEQLFQDNT